MPKVNNTPSHTAAYAPYSKRRQLVPVKKAKDYFVRPKYTCADDAKAGGKYSRVVLGPNGYVSFGSDANSSLPSGIQKARDKYPGSHFKAGHMLNAEFGGDGKDPENMTILSATGNSNHKAFDNRVKDAALTLKQLYELLSKNYVDVTKIKYGIEVEVKVSDTKWGANPPDSWICEELKCSAKVWGNIDFTNLKDSNDTVVNASSFKSAAERYMDSIRGDLAAAVKTIENPP